MAKAPTNATKIAKTTSLQKHNPVHQRPPKARVAARLRRRQLHHALLRSHHPARACALSQLQSTPAVLPRLRRLGHPVAIASVNRQYPSVQVERNRRKPRHLTSRHQQSRVSMEFVGQGRHQHLRANKSERIISLSKDSHMPITSSTLHILLTLRPGVAGAAKGSGSRCEKRFIVTAQERHQCSTGPWDTRLVHPHLGGCLSRTKSSYQEAVNRGAAAQ